MLPLSSNKSTHVLETGMAGRVAGLGLIVMGGVMSAALVTLPVGVPLIIFGATYMYSTGKGIQHARKTETMHEDFKVTKKLSSESSCYTQEKTEAWLRWGELVES
jgi:hypothetical protein